MSFLQILALVVLRFLVAIEARRAAQQCAESADVVASLTDVVTQARAAVGVAHAPFSDHPTQSDGTPSEAPETASPS